jgi:hypothetical protein
MKRQLAALFLFALAFGALQLPAQAGVNVSFGRHDYNNDGRWDRREFYDANRYYYQRHPSVQVISRRDLNRDYDRLDTNHDGYLSRQEVRTYRTWE